MAITHQSSEGLRDAAAVGELFDAAAKANLEATNRQGARAVLPRRGRVVLSGDLHDHAHNFLKLVKLAQLEESPDHHLVLHEFVHGPTMTNGLDLSYRLLARAAALKLRYPQQVHVLLANHELAQMTGDGITKDGVSVVEAFDAGLEFVFGDQTARVQQGMGRFIRSMLLAVKLSNGLLVSHSLPSPRQLPKFDPTVLERAPRPDDLRTGGSAHSMVWGRAQDDEVAHALAAAWNVELFVMGHQPAEMGYNLLTPTMLVLASNHEHGMALPIDLRKRYTMDDLVTDLMPLAGVVL